MRWLWDTRVVSVVVSASAVVGGLCVSIMCTVCSPGVYSTGVRARCRCPCQRQRGLSASVCLGGVRHEIVEVLHLPGSLPGPLGMHPWFALCGCTPWPCAAVAPQTRELAAQWTEHSSVLQSFAFNADKTLLITASADNTAKVGPGPWCGGL